MPKATQKPASKVAPTPSLKVKSLNGPDDASSSQTQKRFNPLTAFSKVKPPSQVLPSTERTGSPLSQSMPPPTSSSRKGKGKAANSPPLEMPSLWLDIFKPDDRATLAVHDRKVQDVERWISEAFDGGPTGKLAKYRRVLALTGPAGSGKTATLEVLSREMNFDILEWKSSTAETFSNDLNFNEDYESPISHFERFIERAMNCSNVLGGSTQAQKKRHVVLLEDLPNILHHGTRERFHSLLKMLVNTPLASPPIPLVIILSDSGLRPGDLSEGRSFGRWGKDEALDIRSVLPRELLQGPFVTHITFNPVAQTYLKKALSALPMPSEVIKSKTVLETIVTTSNGDIRSAIMSLQFACIVDNATVTASSSHKAIKMEGNAVVISSDSEHEVALVKKKRPKTKKKKSDVKVVLQALTQREHALVIFHLIGKVLWNKRRYDPPPPKAAKKDIDREAEIDRHLKDEPRLPPWMKAEERRTSRVDVNALQADSPIDASLLSLYIHHNYTPYCEDLDECMQISETLSAMDTLGSWQNPSPVLFHLLVMGTQHGLPSPVKRKGQKVFKPDYFEVVSKEREAWAAVGDVSRGWLGGSPETAHGWTRTQIATELGGVLKAHSHASSASRVASTLPLPRSHTLFSSLIFQRGDSEEGQPIDEEDQNNVTLSNDQVDEENGLFHAFNSRDDDEIGGWLGDDDIEEF
ncbi:Rad17 cell cycle checkpoint protein-domain-containing protein [Flagelloscypha sp. PMI_526]|nr:Rad17 cell cycle checkpoint protein-domain-containing protein [Flagelloscypha sp. PMI_526]